MLNEKIKWKLVNIRSGDQLISHSHSISRRDKVAGVSPNRCRRDLVSPCINSNGVAPISGRSRLLCFSLSAAYLRRSGHRSSSRRTRGPMKRKHMEGIPGCSEIAAKDLPT